MEKWINPQNEMYTKCNYSGASTFFGIHPLFLKGLHILAFSTVYVVHNEVNKGNIGVPESSTRR